MQDDIDKYMSDILTAIEIWDDDKYPRSLTLAKRLNLLMSVLKLIITPDRFDSLDAFSRYLKETSDYIKQYDTEDNDK